MAECKCPKWLLVKTCCFCVPVRKGVAIFGYVNLILSLLSFPLLIYTLVERINNQRSSEYDKNSHLLVTTPTDLLVTTPSNELFVTISSAGTISPVHITLTILLIIADMVMTVVMIIGALKKKKNLLKIYLYFGIVFQLVTFFVDLAYFDYREHLENTVYFFFLGLNIYLLLLVYNTIRILEDNSEVQYTAYGNQHNSRII